MSQQFSPIQLLKNLANAGRSGHLQIVAHSVTWDLYLVEGKLQYAHHSLQSLETIQHYLLRLNWGAVAKVLPNLAKDIPNNNRFVLSVIERLVERRYLIPSQRTAAIAELTRDALEACLWLTDGQSQWSDANPLPFLSEVTTLEGNPFDLPPLLDLLETKIEAWQKLRPWITSPHQRPSCMHSSLLEHKVPSGNLAPATLEKLVKLMRGISLRQLALFVKQDELKVAQLLFPYIKHNTLQLHSPKPPLDRLPQIPPFLPKPQANPANVKQPTTPEVRAVTSPPTIPPTEAPAKKYKIVCIDDSPTMLDTIKGYLDEKYEIFTVENPMHSLPCLFDSRPDLILMDFSMPGINGNRLCHILKTSSVFKNTPIIMVSGNTKMLEGENFRSMGATDFLAKPFARVDLLAIVEKYLAPEKVSSR